MVEHYNQGALTAKLQGVLVGGGCLTWGKGTGETVKAPLILLLATIRRAQNMAVF